MPEAEAAWLFTIARNVCLSRRRSTWRRGRIEAAADFELVQELTPAPAGRGDELMGLQDVLEQMPESQRRAILLREWQGLSYREIAAELERSQGAVETLIFRARRSLSQGLEAPPQSKRRRVRRGAIVGDAVAALKSLLVAGSAATKVAATVAVVSGATVAATPPSSTTSHTSTARRRRLPLRRRPRGPVAAKPATATAPRATTLTLRSVHRRAAGAGRKQRRTPARDGRAPAGPSLQAHPQDEQHDSAPGESSSEGRSTQAPSLPATELPSGAEPSRGSDVASRGEGRDGAAPPREATRRRAAETGLLPSCGIRQLRAPSPSPCRPRPIGLPPASPRPCPLRTPEPGPRIPAAGTAATGSYERVLAAG